MDDPGLSVHTSVDEIPEWNEVASSGGLYSSAEFLRYAERGQESYLAVREHGAPVAVAACFLGSAPGSLPGPSEPGWLFEGVAPPPALYPVLFCGSVRGYTSRLLIHPGLDAAARAPVVAALIAAVRAEAARREARTVAFGFLPVEDAGELCRADPDLCPAFAQSEAVIGPLTTFDAYLATMTSHRRRSTRLEMRRFAAQVRFDRRPLSEVIEPLSETLPPWVAKYGQHPTVDYTRQAFRKLVECFSDERTRVLCAWEGEQFLGASLNLVHGRTYYSRNFAMRTDAPAEAAIYFNLTFYEAVRSATSEAMTELHLGPNTIPPKVERGGWVRPLWFVFDSPAVRDAAVRRGLLASSRARLAREVAQLTPYRREDQIGTELRLDRAARLLGEAV
jgi:predicted N-acyltransferase